MEETVEVGQVWYESPIHVWIIEEHIEGDLYRCRNMVNGFTCNLYDWSILDCCIFKPSLNSPLYKAINNVQKR